MQERLEYVRYMQRVHFGPLNCDDQFRAIEGVIRFFIDKDLGEPGSWVSYVDAGIVEAIQRGGAIALGKSGATGGNPGSQKWASFMRTMRDGGFVDRRVRMPLSKYSSPLCSSTASTRPQYRTRRSKLMLFQLKKQAHDTAWANAEESATFYGADLGDAGPGRPTGQILRWYGFTIAFRDIMRDPGVLDNFLTYVLKLFPFFFLPP